MEIFSFAKETGEQVTHFDSNFIMSKIMVSDTSVHIGCMHLGPDGVIGYHQAQVPQLLLVVSGEGKVRGNNNEFVHVHKGDAVFWLEGEWHETNTKHGLTAIVVEGKTLNPTPFMPVKGIGNSGEIF